MKKIFVSVAFVFCLFTTAEAAPQGKQLENRATVAPSDSADLIGKYKYEGLPFEYMVISTKEGKLHYSGGEYTGFLEPIKDKKDVFDAGGIAVFTFTRDPENKVKELVIDYQGQTYIGRKENN